jgi:hypothetical protein
MIANSGRDVGCVGSGYVKGPRAEDVGGVDGDESGLMKDDEGRGDASSSYVSL